jgi:hypothetical protein
MSEIPGTGHVSQQDLGFYQRRDVAVTITSQTATAGTGVEVDGPAVNRCDPDVALGVTVALPFKLTMASGGDCAIGRTIEHREDSSESWTEYYDAGDYEVDAQNDGSAQTVDAGFSVDLSGAKSEIRLTVTPNFSASGTDTCSFAGSFVFGGFDTNPPAQ